MTEGRGVFPVRMPKWGLSMQEGTLRSWAVRLGERVEAGAPLCDIETAKITNAFESPGAGVVVRLLAEPDDVVPVGKLIAVLADVSAVQDEIDALVAAEQAVSADSTGEVADAPAMKHVETSRGPMAWLEAGDPLRPSVVLLHGFGGSHANWGLNQGALAESHRTLAFDLPGHGTSTMDVGDGSVAAVAAIVREALDALDVGGPAHLVAHSYGAGVAMSMMAARPGGFRSATLIAPLGLGAPASRAYVEGFVTAKRKRDLKPLMQMLFSNPDLLGREMVNDALHTMREPEARAALTRIADAMPRASDLGAALDGVPSQILWGDRDAIIPLAPGLQDRFAALLHVVRGAGHMPHVEQPAEVNALIGTLIRR